MAKVWYVGGVSIPSENPKYHPWAVRYFYCDQVPENPALLRDERNWRDMAKMNYRRNQFEEREAA